MMVMQSMMGAEFDMTANTSSLTGTIFATIAALLAGADCTSGAERVAKGDSSYCLQNPCPPDSKPREFGSGTSTSVSNDSTSRYVALIHNKSIALDLPGDVSDVFIANPKIANVVLRSKRRAFVIGTGHGQTNVFFYNAKGQQIDGLNVNVSDHEISEKIPEREIMVVRGPAAQVLIYECTPICALAENAVAEKPPPTLLVVPAAPAGSQP
jgi:Flp pilus assembly secretin CpaC